MGFLHNLVPPREGSIRKKGHQPSLFGQTQGYKGAPPWGKPPLGRVENRREGTGSVFTKKTTAAGGNRGEGLRRKGNSACLARCSRRGGNYNLRKEIGVVNRAPAKGRQIVERPRKKKRKLHRRKRKNRHIRIERQR